MAMKRPESRLGEASWRKMMVDGATGDRRCREVTLRRDLGGSTLGPDAWVRGTGRLRGHKVWDVGNWKDGLD